MTRNDADPLVLSVEEGPATETVAEIERQLMAFNVEAIGRSYDRRGLVVVARDQAGTLRGGLTGYTNWQWLYVDCFWLAAEARGRGLGRRLLRAAEAEALARGCRHARLSTYDFQALGFYRRNGYAEFAVLEDYPPGHREHWLRKALGPETDGGSSRP